MFSSMLRFWPTYLINDQNILEFIHHLESMFVCYFSLHVDNIGDGSNGVMLFKFGAPPLIPMVVVVVASQNP